MILNSTIAYNTLPLGRFGAGIDFNTQWDDHILIMNIITGNGGRYWDAIQGQWVETKGIHN